MIANILNCYMENFPDGIFAVSHINVEGGGYHIVAYYMFEGTKCNCVKNGCSVGSGGVAVCELQRVSSGPSESVISELASSDIAFAGLLGTAPAAVGGSVGVSLESDPWDDIVCFEDRAYAEGVAAGALASKEEGEVVLEGMQTGLAKGYVIGLELGFIESNTRQALAAMMVVGGGGSSGEVVSTDGAGALSGGSAALERKKRRLELILHKCSSFPMTNTTDCDFTVLLEDIKALYRSCGLVAMPTGLVDRGTDW